MAKKRFLGYKGKTSTKVIITAVTAGTMALSIVSGSLFARLYDKHQSEDWKDDVTQGFVQEDDIHQIEGDPSNSVVGDIETSVDNIAKPTPEEPLGVEFVEVLAKLTNKSKQYVQSVTNSTTEPNLTITGFSSMAIDSNKGEVMMLGQLRMGENYSNFTATMTNANRSLEIYNLSSDSVSEQQLIDALNEYVDDAQTNLSLQLKQHIQVSNQSDVIYNMLQTRLNDLIALNSTEQVILDEISHLNKAISNVNNLKLTILLDNRQPSQNGYTYAFNASVNTGKYVYSSNFAFESNRILATTAVKHNIENRLSDISDCVVTSIPTSAINKALYLVNTTAFDLQNDQVLTN